MISKFISSGTGNIHMAGICGIGMAGIAFLLKSRGFSISGCDNATGDISTWLRSHGVKVVKGHSPGHISSGTDVVIRTPAVSMDDPEIVQAVAMNKPVLLRGEVLPQLLSGKFSVAVCGTHGKTTTSTFIAQALKATGRQPSWCIGGDSGPLGGVAGAGSGKEMVVEADESDGTLSLYEPDVLVITNIEYDHMEFFGSPAAMEACFAVAASKTRQRILFCMDDAVAGRVAAKYRGKTVSYGLSEKADITCRDVRLFQGGQSFTLVLKGRKAGRMTLPLAGRHNLQNALAVIGVLMECGLGADEIRLGLRKVALPKRRFEVVVDKAGIKVVTDYAHHPTEIAALIRMAQGVKARRRIAVYQPHRYTRTLALGSQFPPAFDGVDELVLVPVYAASEKPLPGSSIWDLYEHFRRYQAQNPGGKYPVVSVAASLEKAWQFVRRTLRKGDLFMVVGAGDVENIAGWAKDYFADSRKTARQGRLTLPAGVRREYPLGKRTTFHAGGCAEYFLESKSLAALAKLIKSAAAEKIPVRMIGGGSNVMVSDPGAGGIIVRLGGKEFGSIKMKNGLVCVGAGVSIASLLAWCEEQGLSGLEFLEGIPGTIGGAIRMNAGAYGDEICRTIVNVRYMNQKSVIGSVSMQEAGFRYRGSLFLADKYIIEGQFRLKKADVAAIHGKRQEIADKRSWWKGLRCAGSIFKNPPDAFAGKLIEEAGLKGCRIGGARVFEKHANVIVTEAGARSSDILALIEKIKSSVRLRNNIELETEVVLLD